MALLLIFLDDTDSAWFMLKQKITGETENDGTKYYQTIASLKNLSNFWRTLKILLINFEISFFNLAYRIYYSNQNC